MSKSIDAVVGLARPDPLVERLPLRFADLRVVAAPQNGVSVAPRILRPSRVRPLDQLLVGGDEILGGRRRILPRIADVVDALQHDDVRDARLAQARRARTAPAR